jgi:carboxyl-terminal processing protease
VAYGGQHEGSYLNFPMVCLVNGGSASGSEIVSACLQDHNRAKIAGERSYGKGSVQNVKQFGPTEAEIKVTVASFWRPNGRNLAKTAVKDYKKMTPEQLAKEDWGVRPDPGFLLKLSPKEEFELAEHLRDLEIIPRRDGPVKEPKPEFKDKQLELGLDYLRSQIKTASRAPSRKAG